MSPALSPASSPQDDFDPNELVKVHGRDIEQLRSDLHVLVERYGDDDKFGKTFEAVAAKDKRVDAAVSTILVQLIGTNTAVRGAITAAVDATDRQWQHVFGKRLGFGLWSVALLVIGALVDRYVLH